MSPPLLAPLRPPHHCLFSLLPSTSTTISRTSRRHVASARRTTKLLRHRPGISAAHPARAPKPRAAAAAAIADHIIFNPPSAAPNPHHTPPLFLPPEDPRRGLLVQAAAHANPYQAAATPTARLKASTMDEVADTTVKMAPLAAAEGMSALAAIHHERLQQRQQVLRQQQQQQQHQNKQQQQLYAQDHHPPLPPSASTTSDLPPPVRTPYQKTYHLNAAQIAEIRALRAADPWQWTRARLAQRFGCTPFFVGMCVPASAERKAWATERIEQAKARWGLRRLGAREERVKRRETWARDE